MSRPPGATDLDATNGGSAPVSADNAAHGGLRVILLSLNWWREKDPRTPLGAAYLYAWLVTRPDLRRKVQVSFVDRPASTPVDRIAGEVLTARPDVVGIGVYVWNNLEVRSVIRALRERGFTGTIVLGGPEISYASTELAFEFPLADYLVKGEGETALEEVVHAVLEHRTASGPGIFTPQSISFEGLAHLPPGVDPVQPQSIPELLPLILKDGFGRIEFQRGCVFACSFCAFPFKDRVFRQLGLSTLREDLSRLRSAGVRELAILDPIFFMEKQRAMAILRALEEELPGTRLEIQSRLEHMDEETVDQVSRMNVLLECGVQSLDPKVQRAIRRGGRPEVIAANLKRLHDRGANFEAHVIFGLPYQTMDSLRTDVDYLLRFRPRRLRLFPLLDHRGTELSNQTRTTYLGRLVFSDSFPRQIVATEWLDRTSVMDLMRAHRLLEELDDPGATLHGRDDLLDRVRTLEQLPRTPTDMGDASGRHEVRVIQTVTS
jgi:radical SAM superfamily enzyme YgiQ (UPF0313 family)